MTYRYQPRLAEDNDESYQPYNVILKLLPVHGHFNKVRHHIGGLEKADVTGVISYDPYNHEKMTIIRNDKVLRVANHIPSQEVIGNDSGDLLVVGWGGTYGALLTAVQELQEGGKKISLAQFNYINPLPLNVPDIFRKFKVIIVCELNLGQFATFLRSKLPEFNYMQFNKVQGLPFMIAELKQKFNEVLNNLEK
jgi:2-oxoglutarate ferredoxin oxidoreductase subunit alpha